MSEPGDPARLMSAQDLFPGRLVEVWGLGGFFFRARVEECVPHLEVVWVLESALGQRRLVPVHQCRRPASEDPVAPGG